jgi:hypothetical protein
MAPAPELDAANLVGSAKVVAVARLAQPTPLTGRVTGPSTNGLGTIVLASLVTRIGDEKLGATAAFASGRVAAHREPDLEEAQSGRKSKRRIRRTRNPKKEEEI